MSVKRTISVSLELIRMAISKPSSTLSQSVRVRLAEREDTEKIKTVINSAFRLAENFFVEGDRVDVESVLNLLDRGKFLLAESERQLLGCVYVEPRPLLVDEGSPALLNFQEHPPGDQDSNLGGEIRNPQSAIKNPKFPRAYLGLLAVDPAHQQSGLGSTLMNAAEDYCRAQGADYMEIKVVNLREDLFGFYRRRGYGETGTSPFPAEIKTKVPCHFIEMSKPLNGHS
jgi:ribosomal protein S18 acetylase RimI-like enzyme